MAWLTESYCSEFDPLVYRNFFYCSLVLYSACSQDTPGGALSVSVIVVRNEIGYLSSNPRTNALEKGRNPSVYPLAISK